MTRKMAAAALLLTAFTCSALPASAGEGVCERQMQRASKKYDVPLGVLYAVGLTESGTKKGLSPYAMNLQGRPYFATSMVEAVAKFEEARGQGIRLIDLGCMQINHRYHGSQFRSVQHMLEPAANVDYAARFLKKLFGREKSWTLAVARYHAGPDNDPAQKRYVCQVIANMVRAGVGAWTAAARSFCD